MNKQDTIISLLKEINENVDNLDQISIVKDIVVTDNDKEYLPDDYGADGFSKVTTKFDISSLGKVKVSTLKVTNACLDENGYWAGELLDTSNINTMANVFGLVTNLKSLDVSNWDVSNVTDMNQMFLTCKYLKSLDVSNWDVSNVTNTSGMFTGCSSLQSLVGNRTMNDVLANNIGAFNGLKVNLILSKTIIDSASLRAIINGLADLTGSAAKTLTLSETLINKLTEEDIAIATAKNWTIA